MVGNKIPSIRTGYQKHQVELGRNLGVGVTHIDEISQKLKEVVDNVQRRRKGTFIIDQTFISLMWIPKSEIGQYEIDISSRRQL